jgi:hypothetical protein
VILMKTAVLHTEGIAFTPWGIAVVKAVVLAKLMPLVLITRDGLPGDPVNLVLTGTLQQLSSAFATAVARVAETADGALGMTPCGQCSGEGELGVDRLCPIQVFTGGSSGLGAAENEAPVTNRRGKHHV